MANLLLLNRLLERRGLTIPRARRLDEHLGAVFEYEIFVAFDGDGADAGCAADDGSKKSAFSAACYPAKYCACRGANSAAHLRVVRPAAGFNITFFIDLLDVFRLIHL